MSKQEVILCTELGSSLQEALARCPHDRLFLLTDVNTHRLCRPRLEGLKELGAEYAL